MGKLDGKVALISGAARGQGAAHARELAAEGASVVVADVLEEEAGAVVAELGERGRAIRLDVTDEDAWDAAVTVALGEFGGLDVLVNNAGVMGMGLLADMTAAQFRAVLEVNTVGQFLGIRAAIGAMGPRGGGSIVNVSSTSGFVGSAGLAAYSTSKFAVRGLTRSAALELGPLGIRVNSIHPGGVDTAMTQGPEWAHLDRDAFFARLPVPRIGQPEDVTKLVVFLASSDSAYCTGAEFVVDGGMLAGAGY